MKNLFLIVMVVSLFACKATKNVNQDCIACNNYLTTNFEDKPILELLRDFTNNNPFDLDEVEEAVFPVRFLLMHTPDRKMEISEAEIVEVVAEMNKAFKKAKIQFELFTIESLGTEYVMEDFNKNSSDYYNFSEYDQTRHGEMLSIYIMKNKQELCEITSVSKRCSRVDGLSDIGQEGPHNIVVSEFALHNKKTIVHELGHFFGLRHTFDKTEGKEKADGSNCAVAGDLLCSTPADPDELFYVNFGSCEMKGNLDEAGNSYKPLINNYMNYYYPCHMIDFAFTDQQSFIINQMANSHIKNKLQKDSRIGL